MPRFDHDVVILGSGLAGSLTAALCRGMGLSVLLVEKTDHPHFSIGEAVTGEVMRRLDYLAARYKVPGVAHLSSYTRIKNAGLPIATWPKAHIAFIRHERGKPVDPEKPEEVVVQASTWPLGPDAHAYRPEFDKYVKDMAVGSGATYFPNTEAVSFSFDRDTGASLELQTKGAAPRAVTCRLVVDATGPACWLSRHLDVWRPDSLDVPMASATVFAHFKNVRSWDEVFGGRPLVFPRDHGTLLHVGAHGMLWVIRFDNGIASVGWVTGEELPADIDGETLFWNMIRERPSLAAQMEGAEPVTKFYRIDRVQYSTERVAGDGWFLLPASAEFSDPLFSVGLPLTLAAISRVLSRLETVKPDRPVVATDLDGLEATFRLESKYIRRFTKATKRCFLDWGLLNRAINLNRLLVFREGAYIGTKTQPQAATAAAWGVDDVHVRGMIDAFHDLVMQLDLSKPVPPSTYDAFDRMIERWDVDGFSRTAFGRLRDNGVYLNSLPRLLDYFWKSKQHPLGLGKTAGFVQVSRRWVESFASTRPFAPKSSNVPRGVVRDQIRSLLAR